ncbi:MAG TPA: hypothetical protein VFW90_00925 [Candidatus Saccharimonadales bacterium]|nr:hypothetical protein [Candidatus Saccharimonadales bacterium]
MKKYLTMAAFIVVMALAFGFARTPATSAALEHSLYGQCGGAVHSGSQLVGVWRYRGVLNDPETRSIARSAGWREMDGSLSRFVAQRGREFQLAEDAWIEDFGCEPGNMFSVGLRHYGAGERVIGIVPKKYSPNDVSGTPRAGFVRKVVFVHVVGRGNCANGFRKFVRVVMYVRHHKKTVVRKTKQVVVWAWKYAQVNGKFVNGKRFPVFVSGRRGGKHWTMTSGKWTALGPFRAGHVPKSFTEIIKAPWKAQKSAVQKVKRVNGKYEVIFSNFAAPAKPKPVPPPPPPPPVITITQVCSNGVITVIVGNGNTVTQNGNVQGGNCNGSPPPPCNCTPTPPPCGSCVPTPPPPQPKGNENPPPPPSNPGGGTTPVNGDPGPPAPPPPPTCDPMTDPNHCTGVDSTP